MPVRVLRLMEYIYPTAEIAVQDQERWAVQKTLHVRDRVTIRSTVLPMEILDQPTTQEEGNASITEDSGSVQGAATGEGASNGGQGGSKDS